MRTYSRLRRRGFNKEIVIALMTVLILSSFMYSEHMKKVKHKMDTAAFKVMIEGNEVGVVRNQDEIDKVISELQEELCEDYDMDVTIHSNTTYVDVYAEDDELTSNDNLKMNIKSKLDYNVIAYAIVVDGEVLGALKTQESADEILDKIKEPYKSNDENTKIEKIEFIEDVKIEKREVAIAEISEADKLLTFLQKGTDEEKEYIVQNGDSYWTIAQNNNITVDNLIVANPGKDAKLIHPGDKLSLIVPKPYIGVATIEKQTYEQGIKYATKYEYTTSMYNDESKVKTKGVSGKSRIVAEVEKHNGVEVGRVVLNQSIISEPVTQVVLKGSSSPPPKKGTGIFINPLPSGRLTSRFGMRWGSMHQGIDLAANIGTPIKAADGGIVTYAGWQGTYGYMVEVDHGGGFKTRYAHCSKIYVKVGQKVYKNKTIAAVGSTGRSTGPHVHFEVRKYNVAQNPYDYIGKKYR